MWQNEALIENLNENSQSFWLGGNLTGSFIFTSFIATSLIATSLTFASAPGLALPPADDVPEEVLRTEIITEARSPVDGEWLTAAEYAELEADLQRNPELYNSISPQIRQIIFLLQVRRSIRSIAPFLLP